MSLKDLQFTFFVYWKSGEHRKNNTSPIRVVCTQLFQLG